MVSSSKLSDQKKKPCRFGLENKKMMAELKITKSRATMEKPIQNEKTKLERETGRTSIRSISRFSKKRLMEKAVKMVRPRTRTARKTLAANTIDVSDCSVTVFEPRKMARVTDAKMEIASAKKRRSLCAVSNIYRTCLNMFYLFCF